MIINVFGSTISALVTAACLAETGNNVTLIGQVPNELAEPGLKKLLKTQTQQGNLEVNNDFRSDADFHIFAYGDGDCSNAQQVARTLATARKEGSCLIIRSNFGIHIVRDIMDVAQMPVIINPDFAPEGSMVSSFQRPDRIIIGSTDQEATQKFRRLMAPFNYFRDAIIEMSPESAVLTKYATNVLIATRISLMNELALVAEQMDADIEDVRQGMGSDHRIGFAYLHSGVGFGGAYLERDLDRVQQLIDQTGSQENLLRSVHNINEQQKELLFRKLWTYFQGDLEGKKVALWGVSYKPNTNSIDGSPSLVMIDALLHQGCELHLYDPKLDDTFKNWMASHLNEAQQSQIHIHENMYEALQDVDALCVMTEWKNFWTPHFATMKEKMAQPILLDGRNLYDKSWLIENGFTYFGVGR